MIVLYSELVENVKDLKEHDIESLWIQYEKRKESNKIVELFDSVVLKLSYHSEEYLLYNLRNNLLNLPDYKEKLNSINCYMISDLASCNFCLNLLPEIKRDLDMQIQNKYNHGVDCFKFVYSISTVKSWNSLYYPYVLINGFDNQRRKEKQKIDSSIEIKNNLVSSLILKELSTLNEGKALLVSFDKSKENYQKSKKHK